MKRYFVDHGVDPEIQAAFFLHGPQDAEKVPEPVRTLLESESVELVAVQSRRGGVSGITVYRRIAADKVQQSLPLEEA